MTPGWEADVLPIFLGAGRSALSLSHALYRSFGIRSEIWDETPPRKMPFAQGKRIPPALWERALLDRGMGGGLPIAPLLLPGTEAGGAFLREAMPALSPYYLIRSAYAAPHPALQAGDLLGCAYVQGAGRRILSPCAQVLGLLEGAPALLLRQENHPGDLYDPLPETPGLYTVFWGEDGRRGCFPLVLDGGLLLSCLGKGPEGLLLEDAVLCEELKVLGEDVPFWGFFAGRPALSLLTRVERKRWLAHRKRGLVQELVPPIGKKYPQNRL